MYPQKSQFLDTEDLILPTHRSDTTLPDHDEKTYLENSWSPADTYVLHRINTYDSDNDNPHHEETSSYPAAEDKPQSTWPFSLLILRMFLIAGWSRASLGKLISPEWWNGNELTRFLDTYDSMAFYRPFEQKIATASVGAGPFELVLFLVPTIQILIAVGLATNRLIKPALGIAILMNLHFIAAGRVNPSIFYLMIQIALILHIVHSSTSSDDQYLRLKSPLVWIASALAAISISWLPFAKTFDINDAKEDPALALSTVALFSSIGLISPSLLNLKYSKQGLSNRSRTTTKNPAMADENPPDDHFPRPDTDWDADYPFTEINEGYNYEPPQHHKGLQPLNNYPEPADQTYPKDRIHLAQHHG